MGYLDMMNLGIETCRSVSYDQENMRRYYDESDDDTPIPIST